jgi:hypothetical protein
MAKKRDYRQEYDAYQGTPEQIKRRASRNKARAEMIKAGKAKVGDGLDVGHKTGNPMINGLKNLKMQTKKDNRSFPRTKTAGKKNPRD